MDGDGSVIGLITRGVSMVTSMNNRRETRGKCEWNFWPRNGDCSKWRRNGGRGCVYVTADLHVRQEERVQSILPVKEEHCKLHLVTLVSFLWSLAIAFLFSFAKPFKYSSRKDIILLLINCILYIYIYKRDRGLRTPGGVNVRLLFKVVVSREQSYDNYSFRSIATTSVI